MATDGNTINDPDLYYRMSQPFETEEEARKAFSSFYTDVRAAREKHRIRDVVIVAHTVASGYGVSVSLGIIGDTGKAADMLAHAYGLANREEMRVRAKAMAD